MVISYNLSSLEYIAQGNCITIGKSEKGSEERVSQPYKEKREGIAEIDSIYKIKVCYLLVFTALFGWVS